MRRITIALLAVMLTSACWAADSGDVYGRGYHAYEYTGDADDFFAGYWNDAKLFSVAKDGSLVWGSPAITLTPTEIGYLDGASANLQEQINGKAPATGIAESAITSSPSGWITSGLAGKVSGYCGPWPAEGYDFQTIRLGTDDTNTSGLGGGVILSGHDNLAEAAGLIVGGIGNYAQGSIVVGGHGNRATDVGDFVGGGDGNWIQQGDYSVITGGVSNLIALGGAGITIGGGLSNQAGHWGATVPGGIENHALADGSFAAGTRAQGTVSHIGYWLWADYGNGNPAPFNEIAANEFAARARGGFRFVTNEAASAGIAINSTGDLAPIASGGKLDGVDVSAHTHSGTLGDAPNIPQSSVTGLTDALAGKKVKAGQSFTYVVGQPAVGDVIPIKQFSAAATVVRVAATVLGTSGETVAFNVETRGPSELNTTGTDVLGNDLTATLAGASASGNDIGTPGIGANAFLVFSPSAVNGSPRAVVIMVEYDE